MVDRHHTLAIGTTIHCTVCGAVYAGSMESTARSAVCFGPRNLGRVGGRKVPVVALERPAPVAAPTTIATPCYDNLFAQKPYEPDSAPPARAGATDHEQVKSVGVPT